MGCPDLPAEQLHEIGGYGVVLDDDAVQREGVGSQAAGVQICGRVAGIVPQLLRCTLT